MKPTFSKEALESLQKFSSSIEQPMSSQNSFNHDQDFISYLESNGLKSFECKIIEFECNEVATPKITRTPFQTGKGESAKVDYINQASTSRLQMNGYAIIEVTGYGEAVKIRMSVATLAACVSKDKVSLNANIGNITAGTRNLDKKWLSVNTDVAPNFNKLLNLVTPNVSEPNVTAAPKGKDKK
jgi:hypothetical protein